jgi:DNA-binding response OmpR family regulator
MSILLVEDNADLAANLVAALRKEKFTVNHVANGKDALHVISTEPPDIVILDLGLPDMDGLDVLKQLRVRQPDLPVLLLTARSSVSDKVAGLDGGADDYLAKPFEILELLARLRVLSRRNGTANSQVIVVGTVSLDAVTQQVCVEDQIIDLSRREYMLLKALMENAGRIQTRDQLDRKLYGWGEEVASNAVEVHVHHLRKKLGSGFIQTIHGVGYTVDDT